MQIVRWATATGLLNLAIVAGGCSSNELSGRYDLLIAGGVIVDGSGGPVRQGDVAVSGDRIVTIQRRIPASAATTVIRADGLVVAPGFIEPHAHVTGIAMRPSPENFLRQGVTTIVNSLHGLDQPYPLGAFLDTLHVAPNTVWTAGHTWARKRVVGLDDRAPTEAELATMIGLVAEAMDEGAIGLATGLEYVPANYANTAEVIELARAAKRPNARYITHLRDEGRGLADAVREAIAVGRAVGVPVHINHLKSTGVGNAGNSEVVLASIEQANEAGQRVSFDVYPYDAYSTYSSVLFPAWALAGGPDDYAARIADSAVRARLTSEMLDLFRAQTMGSITSVMFRDIAGDARFAGRTLADWLEANGYQRTLEAGIDALIDLQRSGGFTGIFRAMSADDVDRFLRHPLACISSDGDLVTFGEGFPHPRSYGAFPRVLGRYVRERQVLTIEEAIAKMTSRPADAHGLVDRGRLVPGAYADIVVFDRDRIIDRATFEQPHQYAEGVVHLLVNGVPVILDGAMTGSVPGRPIRREQAPTEASTTRPNLESN